MRTGIVTGKINAFKVEAVDRFVRNIPNTERYWIDTKKNEVIVFFDGIHSETFKLDLIVGGDVRYCTECSRFEEK